MASSRSLTLAEAAAAVAPGEKGRKALLSAIADGSLTPSFKRFIASFSVKPMKHNLLVDPERLPN